MSNAKKTFFGALVVSFLALAGCSNAPLSAPTDSATAAVARSSNTPTSEPQSEEASPSGEELKAYFEALATDDPNRMLDAKDLAAPDSNAEAYAIYLSASAQAQRDGGLQKPPSNASKIEGGFSLCPAVVATGEGCFKYTNIEHDGDRIANFNAGGTPISDRLALGNGKSQPLGEIGQAKLIASYKTISDNVAIVFEVVSKSNGLFLVATYVAPNGRQSESAASNGPMNLSYGSFDNYVFYFEGPSLEEK